MMTNRFSIMQLLATLALLCTLIGVVLSSVSYSGHQVWKTAPLSKTNIADLTTLLHEHKFESYRGYPRIGREAFIRTAAENVQELRDKLKSLNLQPQLYIGELGGILKKQQEQNDAVKKMEIFGLNRNLTFDRYMNFTEISEYLDEVAATYPNLATLEVIGQSYEGRPLKLLKISNNSGTSKPFVFVNSGIHASEWLDEPMAMYNIYQLTELAAQNQEMLDLADWYILTVSNPDGYEFSWTDDRLWRKTRRPNEGSTCIGTDPNRNFDIHWGEGNETDPCLWNYPGPNVYSEIEVKALADYVSALGQTGRLALYMDVHTPGPFLIHPYGYTTDPPAPEVISAANEAILAVEAVRGTDYLVGNTMDTYAFLGFGISQDFAYDVAGAPYAYTWELPPGGASGMDPPPSEIQPVIEETWEGFKVLVRIACAAFAQNRH